MTKTCTRCKTKKALTEFGVNRTKKDGLQSLCRTCNQEQKRVWYKKNNEYARTKIEERKTRVEQAQKKIVWEYLLTHPCVDCGETDPLVLEFDHVRGTKTKEVGRMIHDGASNERLLAEIEKCDIRCANCHKRKTIKERGWWRGEL